MIQTECEPWLLELKAEAIVCLLHWKYRKQIKALHVSNCTSHYVQSKGFILNMLKTILS
jgi:hypothetical protein